MKTVKKKSFLEKLTYILGGLVLANIAMAWGPVYTLIGFSLGYFTTYLLFSNSFSNSISQRTKISLQITFTVLIIAITVALNVHNNQVKKLQSSGALNNLVFNPYRNQNEVIQRGQSSNYSIERSLNSGEAQIMKNMIIASRNSDLKTIREILEMGFHVNDTLMGLSPLYSASGAGQNEVVSYLVRQGADIDMLNGPSQLSALHAAVKEGHIDTVALLLELGAHKDIKNHRGRTPLYYLDLEKPNNYIKIRAMLGG